MSDEINIGMPVIRPATEDEIVYLRATVGKLGLWFESLGPDVIKEIMKCPGDFSRVLETWTRYDAMKSKGLLKGIIPDR